MFDQQMHGHQLYCPRAFRILTRSASEGGSQIAASLALRVSVKRLIDGRGSYSGCTPLPRAFNGIGGSGFCCEQTVKLRVVGARAHKMCRNRKVSDFGSETGSSRPDGARLMVKIARRARIPLASPLHS